VRLEVLVLGWLVLASVSVTVRLLVLVLTEEGRIH
jgi:hypothetical protein